MDQLLKDVGNSLSGVFSSDVVQLGLKAIGIYIVIVWLATAYWAYEDMKSRTLNPLLPYLAAALIIVFTPLLFVFAALLYRIIRPHERVGEAHERMLAEEAMLAEVERLDHCLGCGRRTEDGWLVCPTCRTRLRRVCPNCGKLVGTDWLLCAWCGTDFEVPQVRGATAGAGPYATAPGIYRGGRPAPRQAQPIAAAAATGAPAPTSERSSVERYSMAVPAPAARPAYDDVPPTRDEPRPVPAPAVRPAARTAFADAPASWQDSRPAPAASASWGVADDSTTPASDTSTYARPVVVGGTDEPAPSEVTTPVPTPRVRTRRAAPASRATPIDAATADAGQEPAADPTEAQAPPATTTPAAPISGRRAAQR